MASPWRSVFEDLFLRKERAENVAEKQSASARVIRFFFVACKRADAKSVRTPASADAPHRCCQCVAWKNLCRYSLCQVSISPRFAGKFRNFFTQRRVSKKRRSSRPFIVGASTTEQRSVAI
jgi:hypothetical protein